MKMIFQLIIPEENCATEEFNDAYPMAEQSYVLPATDSDLPAINHDTPLNIDNTWIFENVTTNNEIISTQAVGKPKLLIYFISVYDCLSQFQGLYKENADLDIIAMPMDTAVKEDVQKFQELYDYKNITFTYEGKDSLIADQLGRYLYLKDCNRVCYPFLYILIRIIKFSICQQTIISIQYRIIWTFIVILEIIKWLM